MKGLKDMTSAFRREKLPVPVIPDALQGRVEKLRDWAWGTRKEHPSLYEMDSYVDEAVEQTEEDYVLLGQAGHGTNSWFLFCYVTTGPLGIFVQAPWGGAYAEMKMALDGVQRRFAVLEKLLRAGDQAITSGRSLPGRLIVQQSSVASPRWGWARPGEPVPWQEEFANAMTPALESLQHHIQIL